MSARSKLCGATEYEALSIIHDVCCGCFWSDTPSPDRSGEAIETGNTDSTEGESRKSSKKDRP